MKQMVLREIKWFRLTNSCWCRNHQKYKSEMEKSRLELSSLCGVWRNVLYLWTIYRNVFVAKFQFLKKRNCKTVLNDLKQKTNKQSRGFWVWRTHWTGL